MWSDHTVIKKMKAELPHPFLLAFSSLHCVFKVIMMISGGNLSISFPIYKNQFESDVATEI